jgi:hypothetical protein
MYEIGSVIEWNNLHTLGQKPLDILQFGFDSLSDGSRIFADKHHRHADDDFTFPVFGCEALPHHGRKVNLGNIPD